MSADQPKPPSDADAEAAINALSPPTGNDDDNDFYDFASDLKKKWRDEFKPAVGDTLRNAPEARPPLDFDATSICAQDCKYYHWVKLPIDIIVDDPDVPGGRRPFIATVRRCLLGVLQLPSDEPTIAGAFKKRAEEAQICLDCSHYYPLTDEELADRDRRRTIARIRSKRKNGEEVPENMEEAIAAEQKELAEARKLLDADDDLRELTTASAELAEETDDNADSESDDSEQNEENLVKRKSG